MAAATPNREWHGVPAGTQLTIVDRIKFMQTEDCFVVRRVDGGGFPSPYGYEEKQAVIGAEYVEV